MILTKEFKANWNVLEKVLFRFLFSYFTLYCLGIFLSALWKPLVIWVAKSILKLTYDFNQFGYGSGDNTYQYVLLLIYVVVAFLSCLIWTAIDHKRASYNNLNYGLQVFLRFILIYFLIFYGLIKVFHLQMIPPTYAKLMRPLGEMSPMGLAWTFMGYSKGYSMFAGGMEVLAGLLLIPRKTVTLGALVTVGVMTQVFIMNLCFDIPVKIFSFHLLLMGLFLFLSDSKRFVNAIIRGKSVANQYIYPKLNKEESTIIMVVKAFLFVVVIAIIYFGNISRTQDRMKKLNTPFGGVWQVRSFQKNGVLAPEDFVFKKAWKNLILDTETSASVIKENNTTSLFYIKIDTVAKKISFKETKDGEDNWFDYQKDKHILKLNGILENDTLKVMLHHKTKKDFLLTNRPFSWINEKPFNR